MVSYQSALKKSRKGPGVSAAFLKLLALVTMTIDHFAVVIIRNGKLYGYSQEYYQMAIATETGQRWLRLYTLCRYVGRLSFPIFAFLLVEGFIHTSDFWKYFRRVFIMALLAEVPYDLCFYNETYNFAAQNTGFTLATALLVMYFMKRWRSHVELKWLSVIAGCAIAEYLHFDYGALAILMISLMYNFRKEKNLSMLSLAVFSAINSKETYCLAALAAIPVFFYNGEQGRFRLHRFPYFYYPLHLAVMYLMIYIGSLITT